MMRIMKKSLEEWNLIFSKIKRSQVWKEHMKAIMNEEDECDQVVEVDEVEGS